MHLMHAPSQFVSLIPRKGWLQLKDEQSGHPYYYDQVIAAVWSDKCGVVLGATRADL